MQKPGLFGMNGFIVFLLSCLSFAARAQQSSGYVILIDAENKQAFVVHVGNQSFFSSSHGHLVLPQLKDSTYKLNIRLPKKNLPGQVFTVAVHSKDLGFQLKGNDSLLLLYNWQTREIIHPVFEKDSSLVLEQGVKREDGFSRLMAAVVDDTAVLYNTYALSNPGQDSSLAKIQNRSLNPQNPTKTAVASEKTDKVQNANPVSQTQMPATLPAVTKEGINIVPVSITAQQTPALNKDSLLEVKRQEIHERDSINTARKAASRDSLIIARKQQAFIKDSLNTARKAAARDSLAIVKKQQIFLRDSLTAARKAVKDSLIAAKKAGSNENIAAAQKARASRDSLLAAEKEKTVQDSMLAVERAVFIRDSTEQANTVAANGHHSSLTRVKKLREVSLKISRKMVFLDIGKNGRADTITLFVYFESASDTAHKKRPGGEPAIVKKQAPPDLTGVKKSISASGYPDTSGLSKIPVNNKNADSSGLSGRSPVKKSSGKTGDAAYCSQVATEEDTESLRSAILKANSEQEKIAVAAGAFALKCFSVNQIRLLASLLVSDKARYGLMDASRLHITDRDHFAGLVDMLTDKNFQRKFLVMAEKRS